MREGSKHIAILGMAAAIAGAVSGKSLPARVGVSKESRRRMHEVPNKTSRGKRRRQVQGRH